MVRALSLRPHHDGGPPAWWRRRRRHGISHAYYRGNQRAHARRRARAGNRHRTRIRPSVLVRDGRHQRIRRSLARRRHQQLHRSEIDGRALRQEYFGDKFSVRANGRNRIAAVGYFSIRTKIRCRDLHGNYISSNSYGGITYGKTATVLLTLEKVIGEDTLRQALHAYFMRYRFTHPTAKIF